MKGSLIYCPVTQAYGEDDYLVFDCPGQIELYSHLSMFKSFVDYLKADGWSVCVVYCLDCHFVSGMPQVPSLRVTSTSRLYHIRFADQHFQQGGIRR